MRNITNVQRHRELLVTTLIGNLNEMIMMVEVSNVAQG